MSEEGRNLHEARPLETVARVHGGPLARARSSVVQERMGSVSIAGQRTRLLDVGEGYPVVVLHGWGGRIESMAPVIRCLARDLRVLALDLPGFGEAPLPDGVWGTPDHAEYVADVLAHRDVHRAHFVGHSFGAKTAFYLAATHRSLVDKLVLLGPNGVRLRPTVRARVKKAIARPARSVARLGPAGRWVRDAVYRRTGSDDYRNAGPLRPMLVKTVNENFSHLLPLVGSATLLVWGTEDDAVPLAVARTMERLIPDAGLVLFEGAGHFAYLDELERFCRVARHFFGAG
jgi:pimeloyl-ACP methyl ester carboxylesterase